MPCRDDYPEPSSSEIAADARQSVRRQLEPLLCEVLKLLRGSVTESAWRKFASAELKKWVDAHDKKDAARIRREAKEKAEKELKAAALKKLTAKERKALGL